MVFNEIQRLPDSSRSREIKSKTSKNWKYNTVAYSEPCQTSKMERFAKDIKDVMKILNTFKLLKC